ncbi:hypothetical protein FRB93_012209 [Tulasnella sp. JGI-2019a]|nr:hypothetical protein FRB93_012209 [Tulasnella sp. JGI-2019a]
MAKTSDSASSIHENGDATPDAAAAAPAEVAVIAEGESGEGGKMKMIVQLVKRCLGVKDIAAIADWESLVATNVPSDTRRLSLPASLLEPLPNLEYWNYLDRPDLFAA